MLSLAIREKMPPEAAAEWLLAVRDGVDPSSTSALQGASPIAVATGGYSPPDWSTRRKAMELLLAYGYGTPVQLHVVEAEIRALTVTAEAGPLAVGGLDAERLERLRGDLRALVAGAPAAPHVVDAVGVERE